MDIRKNDLHASSVRLYEYTRSLAEDGADTGCDGMTVDLFTVMVCIEEERFVLVL